jgi:hypothetical protein
MLTPRFKVGDMVRPTALVVRRHPVERVGIIVDFNIDEEDDTVDYSIFWIQSEITIVGWKESRLEAA